MKDYRTLLSATDTRQASFNPNRRVEIGNAECARILGCKIGDSVPAPFIKVTHYAGDTPFVSQIWGVNNGELVALLGESFGNKIRYDAADAAGRESKDS